MSPVVPLRDKRRKEYKVSLLHKNWPTTTGKTIRVLGARRLCPLSPSPCATTHTHVHHTLLLAIQNSRRRLTCLTTQASSFSVGRSISYLSFHHMLRNGPSELRTGKSRYSDIKPFARLIARCHLSVSHVDDKRSRSQSLPTSGLCEGRVTRYQRGPHSGNEAQNRRQRTPVPPTRRRKILTLGHTTTSRSIMVYNLVSTALASRSPIAIRTYTHHSCPIFAVCPSILWLPHHDQARDTVPKGPLHCVQLARHVVPRRGCPSNRVTTGHWTGPDPFHEGNLAHTTQGNVTRQRRNAREKTSRGAMLSCHLSKLQCQLALRHQAHSKAHLGGYHHFVSPLPEPCIPPKPALDKPVESMRQTMMPYLNILATPKYSMMPWYIVRRKKGPYPRGKNGQPV